MKRHDKKLKAKLVDKWQASGERKSDFATRHGIRKSDHPPIYRADLG